ncbi:hypothetical protein TNCT_345611 [Trichonephila clavata]|uniref:Uncharacterized protein n=1 Tax=Trichonephila clavata TaxID=2740835 RepID=A0A8X6M1N5_TRICU|nr:hypothetical protein TNCT_345611 [Trichonephila clavata]
MLTIDNVRIALKVITLVAGKGRSESLLFDNEVDQDTSASGNSPTVAQPAAQAERRLSLEDFFLNRNNQQEQPAAQQLQAPDLQLQVQQPNPDSVVLVRDAQLPSGGSGCCPDCSCSDG